MAQHPQQGEQPCPVQEHRQHEEPSWGSARRAAVQESGRGVPGARSFRAACLMHFFFLYKPVMWRQALGAKVDLLLLFLCCRGAQLLAALWPPPISPLNSRQGMGHASPEDRSDTSFSPRKVLAHEAETAGAVMAFFLSLGLALGAAISFLFRILI